MPKHRFNQDWKDEKTVGNGDKARVVSHLEYSAGVAYSLDADTLARAQAAGVLGEARPAAVTLDRDEADIRKMKKDDAIDFFIGGGRVILSADLKAEVDQLKAQIIEIKGNEQDFIDSWNEGLSAEEQADTLADIRAAVQLMKEQAAAGE